MITHNVMRGRLGAEMWRAYAALEAAGSQPTHATAPLLLEVLTSARDGLASDGMSRARQTHSFGSLQFEVCSIWAADGLLLKFQLRLTSADVIVFAGDRDAHLLPVHNSGVRQ